MLDHDGETVRDWIEQLEMVASICHWDQPTKLVNLVTQLRGQAYAFYRTCLQEQRNNYESLTHELLKRFTPVHIQSVQSSLFHKRRQRNKETVDNYAQDLKRLFLRAYLHATQVTREAEEMGCSVLTYQFTAGLVPEIKRKIAGCTGTFEEVLVRA